MAIAVVSLRQRRITMPGVLVRDNVDCSGANLRELRRESSRKGHQRHWGRGFEPLMVRRHLRRRHALTTNTIANTILRAALIILSIGVRFASSRAESQAWVGALQLAPGSRVGTGSAHS